MDSTVLLVGDIGPRFELELVQAGFACAQASTANDAVAQMKSNRFPVVVVPPALSDMGGVEFIQGVLRYFDANVVLFGAVLSGGGNGAGGEVEALLRTGRVAHLPSQDGRPLVEILARSVPRQSSPPSSAPMFNLTPGPPQAPLGGVAPSFAPSLASSFAPQTPMAGMPSLPTGGLAASLFAPGGQLGASPGTPAPQRPATFPSMPAAMPGGGAVAPSFQQPFQQASVPPGLVDELARAKADLVAMQARLSGVEQERASLATEVEAARRTAMQQVAQVMALSDEGDPITEELEGLRDKAMEAEAKLEAAKEELGALRAERDRLVAEGVTSSQALAEARAKADADLALVRAEAGLAQAAVAAGQAELAAARAETAQRQAELEQAKADLERAKADLAQAGESEVNLAELRLKLGEREAEIDTLKKLGESTAGELEEAQNAAEGARADLEQARKDIEAAKADFEAARAAADAAEKALEEARGQLKSIQAGEGEAAAQLKTVKDVEGALRIELEKTRADVAAARTDATTSRLDLQEAMMRLDEAQTVLDQLKKDEAQLRAEAEPLRTWAQQIVGEHATQQAELEKLRKELAALTEKAQKAITLEREVAELQIQVDAHKNAPAVAAGTPTPDAEVLMARSRQLAQLVQALEPFMWGLTQATIFFTKSKVDGSDEHVRLLQQLQGVLLRLRDEIAMLDL